LKTQRKSKAASRLEAAPKTVSTGIRERLLEAGVSFKANDSIAEHLLPGELDLIEHDVAVYVRAMLHALVIDQSDPNTR
jgi:hypothetical protein